MLKKGITVGGKALRDHMEAHDHCDALVLARSLAAGEAPLDEETVRDLHRLVLRRTNPAEAGLYSQFLRRIAGSSVVLPTPVKLPRLMADFGTWLADQPATPPAAVEAHFRLVTIHPFIDCNGRTARLLMTLLLRGGYPPLVVEPEHRQTYIETLEAAQLGGQGDPHDAFMAGRLETALADYLDAVARALEAIEAPER